MAIFKCPECGQNNPDLSAKCIRCDKTFNTDLAESLQKCTKNNNEIDADNEPNPFYSHSSEATTFEPTNAKSSVKKPLLILAVASISSVVSIIVAVSLVILFAVINWTNADLERIITQTSMCKTFSDVRSVLGEPDYEEYSTNDYSRMFEYSNVKFKGEKGSLRVFYSGSMWFAYNIPYDGALPTDKEKKESQKFIMETKEYFTELYGTPIYVSNRYVWSTIEGRNIYLDTYSSSHFVGIYIFN